MIVAVGKVCLLIPGNTDKSNFCTLGNQYRLMQTNSRNYETASEESAAVEMDYCESRI